MIGYELIFLLERDTHGIAIQSSNRRTATTEKRLFD
jgi:hypothetical protein